MREFIEDLQSVRFGESLRVELELMDRRGDFLVSCLRTKAV